MNKRVTILALLIVLSLLGKAQPTRIFLDRTAKEGFVSINFRVTTSSKKDSIRWFYLSSLNGKRLVTLSLNPDGTMGLFAGGKQLIAPTKSKHNYWINIGVDIDKKQVQARYGTDSIKMNNWSEAELTYDDYTATDASLIQTVRLEMTDLSISLPLTKIAKNEDIWNGLKEWEITRYRSWVATLPQDQFEWELLLQQHLGSFYFPHYVRDRNKGKYSLTEPGDWGFVTDDISLARILLIGDSISRSYTDSTRKRLAGIANVHRAPANCGPSTSGLKNIDSWLGNKPWDIITFNFGIHDSKGSVISYAANLQKIIDKLKATKAKLIWVRTTPVYDKETGIDKTAGVNQVADSIMAINHIRVGDVKGAIMKDTAYKSYYADGVHFNNKGISLMAEEVAKSIKEALEENKKK
jgi:lysophospholipase L1-like esterase